MSAAPPVPVGAVQVAVTVELVALVNLTFTPDGAERLAWSGADGYATALAPAAKTACTVKS